MSKAPCAKDRPRQSSASDPAPESDAAYAGLGLDSKPDEVLISAAPAPARAVVSEFPDGCSDDADDDSDE